jgi:hypothetical protein
MPPSTQPSAGKSDRLLARSELPSIARRCPLVTVSGFDQTRMTPCKPLFINQNRAEEFIDQGRLRCTFPPGTRQC